MSKKKSAKTSASGFKKAPAKRSAKPKQAAVSAAAKTPRAKPTKAKVVQKPIQKPVQKTKVVAPPPVEAAVVAAPKKRAKAADLSLLGELTNESASKLSQKWSTLFKKSADAAVPYNISGKFEAKTAILHKVLGWGYVLANRNDRLEVLFRDGIKYLISNYKRD